MTNKHSTTNKYTINLLSAILLVFLISFAGNIKAQFGGAFGAKAGFTTTSFHGSSATDVSARGGVSGGFFLSIQPVPVFSIQPELYFSQTGGSVVINNVKSDIKFTALEFPILLNFRIPVQNTLFPKVFIGPDFIYNTNVNIASVDAGNGESTTVITATDFGKTDVAAVFGFGLDLQANPIFFTIDWRYNYGFRNVIKTSNDYFVNLKNKGWTLSAGIGFQFGGKGADRGNTKQNNDDTENNNVIINQ